jgi:hypothetical protein
MPQQPERAVVPQLDEGDPALATSASYARLITIFRGAGNIARQAASLPGHIRDSVSGKIDELNKSKERL